MKIRVMLFLAVAGICLLITGCGRGNPSPPVQLTASSGPEGLVVHFIDVGQGDAILIRTPQKAILLDSGDVTRDKQEHPVVTYLKKQGITTLDAVIISHPHADHIGGMQSVFAAFPVKRIYDSGQITTTQLYKHYLQQIKEQKIPFSVARAGEKVDLGEGVSLEFLYPQEPLLRETGADLNNNSLVVRVVYGEISFLLAGDIEKEAENLLVKQGGNLKSTLLKVPHHGSNTSSTAAFLRAVAPKTAIIMCGINNDYHHPHDKTLKKYERDDIQVYRTDRQGSIIVMTDGRQYTVKEEK